LRFERLWLALLIAALCAGCQAPRVRQPLTATLRGDTFESQMEFWHELSSRPLTSNDEALHGLLLFFDGKDPATGYADRVQAAKDRGLLGRGFDAAADEAMDRGTLACILVRALKIDGGWALSLLGPTPRYAVRELEYKGLYPPSAPWQVFSGAEFVGIIGRVEDYQQGSPAEAPASTLSSTTRSAP
jgi:hypothetical protein